jgi:hypothetical protein
VKSKHLHCCQSAPKFDSNVPAGDDFGFLGRIDMDRQRLLPSLNVTDRAEPGFASTLGVISGAQPFPSWYSALARSLNLRPAPRYESCTGHLRTRCLRKSAMLVHWPCHGFRSHCEKKLRRYLCTSSTEVVACHSHVLGNVGIESTDQQISPPQTLGLDNVGSGGVDGIVQKAKGGKGSSSDSQNETAQTIPMLMPT